MSNDLSHTGLRWQCRRGMLELDLFLIPFFDAYYLSFSKQKQALFKELLTWDDPTLFGWLMGHDQPNKVDIAELVQQIRQYAQIRHQ